MRLSEWHYQPRHVNPRIKVVCADEGRDAILTAIMVSDKRAQDEAKKTRESEEGKKAIHETGLDITSSLLLPKILWIKRNREEQYKKIRHFLTSNDYLINKLSGRMVTDYLNTAKFHYSAKTEKADMMLGYLQDTGLIRNFSLK